VRKAQGGSELVFRDVAKQSQYLWRNSKGLAGSLNGVFECATGASTCASSACSQLMSDMDKRANYGIS
jgi:hypothetical protein